MTAVQLGGEPPAVGLVLGLPLLSAPLPPPPPLSEPHDEPSRSTTHSRVMRIPSGRSLGWEVPLRRDNPCPERLLELTQGVAVRLLVERCDRFADDLDRVAEIPRIRSRVEDA